MFSLAHERARSRREETVRQESITAELIAAMVEQSPRRHRLRDSWTALRAPKTEAHDWALSFPFVETFRNLCEDSCPAKHNGIRIGTGGRPYAYLRCAEDELDRIREWLATIGEYVALRDCLALSFALDYERENGDPSKPQTDIGALRARAKPYGRGSTAANHAAANELAAACVDFLRSMPCYTAAEMIVPMPASSPSKPFNLPAVIAARVAEETGLRYTEAARTVRDREQLKNIPLDRKLQVLDGTIEIDVSSVRGKTVLLLDDLYQSGVSMNYVAMLLLDAGAAAVLGLAVEKTCRNDDNLGGGPS